jgi:hypothetical protein
MLELTFQYPAWFLIFCVLLGAGCAALLYYRDNTFREQPRMVPVIMAILRFLAVTLLAILLLSPLLKSLLVETKKPVVVLAQDVSESVATDLNGAALEAYKQQWQALKEGLSTDYEVHELAFGDEVREQSDFQFGDKVTNISELLRGIYDLYGGQNLGAVVVASDGVYNEGSNPAYTDVPLSAPVYTVALGDTTPKKDLLVKRVFHNKIAYLGDKFTVQVDVAASNCTGQQTVLSVGKVVDGQTRNLQNIPVNISGNDFFITREIQLEADQPGVVEYVFLLPGCKARQLPLTTERKFSWTSSMPARKYSCWPTARTRPVSYPFHPRREQELRRIAGIHQRSRTGCGEIRLCHTPQSPLFGQRHIRSTENAERQAYSEVVHRRHADGLQCALQGTGTDFHAE